MRPVCEILHEAHLRCRELMLVCLSSGCLGWKIWHLFFKISAKLKKLSEIKPPLKWDQCVKSYTKLILDVVSWCWFACRQDVWGENLATGHGVTSFRMVLDSKGRAGGQLPDLPGSPTARLPGQPAVELWQPEGSDGLLGKPRNFLIWPNP